MVKIILIKSPDELATTKQGCRDELVVYLPFSCHNIYIYIYSSKWLKWNTHDSLLLWVSCLRTRIYIYTYIHIYHIYVCMYICKFFFIFGELLSTLSGEKYIIAKECLYANQTPVLAIYIFLYWAWYNCICFLSQILTELIINFCFSLFTGKKTPTE